MTSAFAHMGSFLLLHLLLLRTPPPPSFQAHISAWRPISQPPALNPSLEAQIPREWNLGLGVGIWALRVGFGPQDWDLGLKAGIWASMLKYGPGDWGRGSTKEREEKKKEKTPHMCGSRCHQSLRDRCPKSTKNPFFTPQISSKSVEKQQSNKFENPVAEGWAGAV